MMLHRFKVRVQKMRAFCILVSLCIRITYVECCGKTMREVYCKNRKYVDYPQYMCPGVAPTPCPKWNFMCACAKNLHRNSNGDCVELKHCESAVAEPEDAGKFEKPPFAMPNRERKSDLTNATIAFVQRTDNLEIVMAALEQWIDEICICIKSTYLVSTLTGAERKFGCYMYAPLIAAPPSMQDQIGTKTMIKVTEDVDINVTSQGVNTMMTLTPAPQPEDAENSYNPRFDILGQYWVLEVDADCLLVAFGSDRNEKLQCILWSVENDKPKNETNCFRYLNSWCTDMYEVWDHSEPCSEFDKKEKRREQLALEEELREQALNSKPTT